MYKKLKNAEKITWRGQRRAMFFSNNEVVIVSYGNNQGQRVNVAFLEVDVEDVEFDEVKMTRTHVQLKLNGKKIAKAKGELKFAGRGSDRSSCCPAFITYAAERTEKFGFDYILSTTDFLNWLRKEQTC